MESAGLLPHSLCIVGNFQGWNFCKFHCFLAICETFLREIGGRGVLWYGKSKQSTKAYTATIVFHQFVIVFSLESFLLYGILPIQFKDMREIWNGFEVNVSWFMPCDVFLSGHFRPSSPSSGHMKWFYIWLMNCQLWYVHCRLHMFNYLTSI